MEIQKVKISDLPVTEDLKGLKTLGTTAENTSKAAELTFIADAATSANESATNANQAAENANTSAANADAKAEAAQKAADNATASANQADQAAVNANTATTRATAAAEKAENAADVAIGVVNEAQQATANANQAAQSANDAATNANQAATSANDAATEAHTQAEYAKTQGDYAKAEGNRVLAEKGQPGGLAELDESGRVPSSQLPSYVDDVINVATYSQLPNPGESGKIYITEDTNLTYRWSGSGYVEISPSLALGETSATAYRGDRGKAAYDHSQIKDGSNPHKTTFASLPDKDKVWTSDNFNPDDKFGFVNAVSDLNNAPMNAAFSTNRDAANAPVADAYFQGFTFAMDSNPNFRRQWAFKDGKIWFRNLHNGSWSAWTDVIPLDNYLPLSGNKTITGNLTVANSFTSGIMKCQTPTYPQLQLEQTNTGITSILFVNPGNALMYRPNGAKPSEDYTVYHSGNLNPDNYLPKTTPTINSGTVIEGLSNVGNLPFLRFHIPGVNYSQFVMDENGTVHLLNGSEQTPGTYKPLKAGPIFSNGNRVWDSGNFNPDSKLDYSEFDGDLNTVGTSGIYRLLSGCTNTPNSGSSQGAHIIHTNWDTNAAHQLYFEYYGSMFYRYKHGGEWSDWKRVWTQFEFNPDSKFNNLDNVNDSDNVVGNGYTITETGSSFSGPFLKWGKKDYMVEFFTGNNINDIRIRNMFNGVWGDSVKMYHSGNLGNATTSQAGLMSAADKTKLDGLSGGGLNIPASGEVAVSGWTYNGKQVYAQRWTGSLGSGFNTTVASQINISAFLSLYGDIKSGDYNYPIGSSIWNRTTGEDTFKSSFIYGKGETSNLSIEHWKAQGATTPTTYEVFAVYTK